MKKGWKIVLSVGLGLLLLSLLSIGFTQTKIFRNWLRGYILNRVHENTNAQLYLGDFSGSLFTGLTITGVSMSLDGEELFTADIVELRYNPLELPQKHIALEQLSFIHPKVNLLRSPEGVWNFQRLSKEKAPSTGPASFLPWTLELKSLEIVGGDLTLVDSSVTKTDGSQSSAPPVEVNPYRRIVLQNINSKLSAAISSQEMKISVERLNLKAPSFSTQLDQFSGYLQYSKEKLVLKNLLLRTTGSALSMNGEADSLDFSKGFEAQTLQNRRVRFDLDAPQISFDELQKFLPAVPLQKGFAQLNVRINGAFGNLQLEKLNLKTERSLVTIGGRIQNFLRPKDATLDLTLVAPSIELAEVVTYLPSLDLPNMSHLEKVSFSGHFKGAPENFEVRFAGDLKMVGMFDVAGRLDLRGPIPQYEGKISAGGFNIGVLLNNKELESRLNLSGEISGKGTRAQDADLTATVTVDSSEIFKLPFGNSVASVVVKDKLLQGDVSISSNQSSIRMHSSIDLHDEAVLAYDLRGAFSSVDLAKIFRDDRYKSKLNGSVALHGSGKDADHVTGSLDLNFQESDFRDRGFKGPGIKLTLDQRTHMKKTLLLESPILDAKMEGDFHLPSFVSLVKYEVHNILQSLREKLPFIDSTRALTQTARASTRQVTPQISKSSALESLNFTYTLDVKNLTPLAIFLGEEDFNAKATVNGSIVGNADDLQLTANTFTDNFVYRGRETRILLTKGTAHLKVDHLKPENLLDALENKIDVGASTFILNGLRMNNLAVSVDYLHGHGSFDVSALIDSMLAVKTNGTVTVTSDGYVSNLDSLTIGYKGYVWKNTNAIVATIDTAGLMLKGFEMAHLATRLSLSGGLLPSRELAVKINLKDYDLSDLRYFLSLESGNGGQKTLQGLASAEVSLNGRLADPSFTIAAAATDLKYGATTFGTFQAIVKYAQQRAALNFELRSSPQVQSQKPDLLVVGSLPVDLALTHVDQRVPDGPLDLHVEATDFHLDLLDPFIPVFDNIEGRFTANVHVGGTAKEPSSSGSMRLEDGKFLFSPNGITYYLSGNFEPAGDKIVVSKFTIRNDPKDEEARGLTVTGEIIMRELSIASFDISGQGQLLILKETARKSNTAPYGNLLIGIGSSGLQYRGTFERSWLTGSVLVKTMSITFPPVSLLPTVLPTSTFSYTVIDDTSKPVLHREPEDSLSLEIFSHTGNGENKESIPTSRSNTFEKLIAGMMADVSIQTQGSAQLRMIIAYSTGEELFSELHGKLLFTKDEFGTRFTGDVEAGTRSYYYFYKRFDATGKLKFAGPLDNPEMDITAVYEGFRTRLPSDTLGLPSASTAKDQRVVVTLKITGTRISPKLTMEMTVDGKDWPGDVQSDAIAFILSGKFRDDLTTTERSQIAANLGSSVTSTVITGVTSSLFSGVLTDFLRREFGGFIRQAEVSYSGGSVSESADLRLTGEIGETVIRVGGRVFNDIGNANVSIQMPVGKIIGSSTLEDLIIELERKVEGSSYATDEKKLTNGARIYYRITF